MALADEVTARYSTQRLVELTNADDKTATTVDTTVLGYAVTDATGEFETRVGVTYDNSNSKHVAVAVQGVLYYLRLYMGVENDALRQSEAKWREGMTALGRVTARDRILPQTKSVLSPSAEQQNSEVVRPDMDREHWDNFVPQPPGQGPHFPRDRNSES